LLLAANELVPATETKVEVEILEIGTAVLVLNCIESIDYLTLVACLTGFNRNVGSGDGIDFVGYLTLLVKKKERRGRRVSAVTEGALGSWKLPQGYFGLVYVLKLRIRRFWLL
jgi:hypothetical protein